MKPVLFIDFDGTLCHDRFWRSLPPVEYAKAQALLFGENRDMAKKWMMGAVTAEAVNKIVAEHLCMSFNKVWDLFVNDCQTMAIVPGALEAIAGIRDRYVIVLLTENMDCFSRFTVPSLRLENYFDEISNSYYTHKRKKDNDGEIYLELASKYGVPITGCVAIDDSFSACTVFEKLGGASYLVTPQLNIVHYLSLDII